MVSRRKKKIQKTLAGHLSATGVDGAPLFATEQAKQDFLDKLKKNEFTKQEILQIALNPDGDSYSWDKDAFPFDARESSATFGEDMGDIQRLIMKKIELDSYLMVNGIYTPVEERSTGVIRQEEGVEDTSSWFGKELVGLPLEERELINNPQWMGAEGTSSALVFPTFRGVIGRMWIETYGAWLILKEIESKATIQEKWDSLNDARASNYDIPNPEDIDPDANINKARDADKSRKMNSPFHFYKDGICFLRSDVELINEGPLFNYTKPFRRPKYFNQKTLNAALKVKEEILSLAPAADNLIIDDIEFPDLDMPDFIHNLVEPLTLDSDEYIALGAPPWIEPNPIPLKDYDISNRRSFESFVFATLVDGYTRHTNGDMRDMGFQFIRRYITSYTKKGVFNKIIEQVENLDIEQYYNKTQERLQECHSIIDSIEKEANEEGLVGAEVLPIKYKDINGFSYLLDENGNYAFDENGGYQIATENDGSFVRPDIEYLYGFDPGDDC